MERRAMVRYSNLPFDLLQGHQGAKRNARGSTGYNHPRWSVLGNLLIGLLT